MEVVLLLLKKYWPYLVMGAVIVGTLGYIKVLHVEINHYKAKVIEVQANYDKLVVTGHIKEADLSKSVAEITAKYQGTLKVANDLVTINAGLNEKAIRDEKELAAVKLNLRTVQLFNASKSTTTVSQPTAAVSGDASGTSTNQETGLTLQDLMLVVNENDANHLKCIQQVQEWQKFWKDYQIAVERNNAIRPQ